MWHICLLSLCANDVKLVLFTNTCVSKCDEYMCVVQIARASHAVLPIFILILSLYYIPMCPYQKCNRGAGDMGCVTHTRAHRVTARGHVALIAGFYEDVSAVAKGGYPRIYHSYCVCVCACECAYAYACLI